MHVELDLPFEINKHDECDTAVYIIHPGAGTVKNIDYCNEVASMPSVCRARLRIEAGDVISMHEGVGEDAGFLLLKNNNANELMFDIQTIVERLKIILH